MNKMKLTNYWKTWMIMATALAGGWACSVPEAEVWPENTGGQHLQVVASFSLVGDWAEIVGGDEVLVRTLVGAEGDPHTYSATPGDLQTLRSADLVLGVGFEMESWLPRLHRSAEGEGPLVLLAEKLSGEVLLDGDPHHHHHHHDHEHGASHSHGHHHGHAHHHHDLPDPHVWMDVRRTMDLIGLIREALTEQRPEAAEVFTANAAAYIEQLEELDREIREKVAGLPPERRKLVTGHQVFAYFAEAYEFEVVGTALGEATTEAFDPGARSIMDLVRKIREAEVPVIFPEAGSDQRAVRRIAEEAGVLLGPELYTDYLSRRGGSAETYLDLMRYNVRVMVDSLGGDGPSE